MKLALAFTVLMSSMSAALGQSDLGTRLRKQYDDCFYSAVISEIRRYPAKQPLDANSIAEVAFQACLTEEQAVMVALGASAPRAIVGVKLQLKARLREVVAHPDRY